MHLVSSGQDELGRFEIRAPGGDCGNCENTVDIIILYNKVSLKRGLGEIDPAATIAGAPGKHIHPLGLNCGCYGKFHRQVAHIRHARRNKAEAKKRG